MKRKRKHRLRLFLVMLCIVFVAGGNLVVYATEDELTNEVDEANENRFSENHHGWIMQMSLFIRRILMQERRHSRLNQKIQGL